MVQCIVWGLLFPLAGTWLGAGLVFFLRMERAGIQRWFCGLAAGVMASAAVFGLLMPGLEKSVWALAGAAVGAAFVTVPGMLTRRRGWLVALAVVLHNIPEGMAAGLSFGGWLTGAGVSASEAVAVGIGIGLQNVPDGAMVSLPLHRQGMPKGRAFLVGAASGLAEPGAAVCMLLWARELAGVLPVLMGFAAGAMGWVVARELVPGMDLKTHPETGAAFLLGLGAMLAVV